MYLIPCNNWNITSYKTVSLATGILEKKKFNYLILALFQCIWDCSGNCYHGNHEGKVILLDFDG